MSNCPASYLLSLYGMRLRRAEAGEYHLPAKTLAGVRQLVSGLSALPPDTEIIPGPGFQPDKYRFVVADTGELVAEIDHSSA